ncbi:MAG TPA: hypothetical protein VGL38_10950 [bacterium]
MQYIGKDVLTQGSLLHLDPKKAWQLLRSRAKQGIRKAKRAGIRMEESRDLSLMARVWYNPDTLTKTLEPEQKLYLAYLGEELVGGIIVTPVTPNTLFYHYGGTNELGRSIEANAYLLWHIVEEFKGSEFTYLDVGVSFRPELQHYFQKYCTQPYPILFRAPSDEVKPHMALNPFATDHLDWVEQQAVAINTQLSEYFEAEFTYLPSWPYALQSALRALELPNPATVGVWASAGETSYIESLREMFGDRFGFEARKREADAYLVCHRWGIPCAEVEELSTERVPLVEDCRDYFYFPQGEQRSGSYGRFAVFDFARWFPLQFGAALVGEFYPDKHVWDHFHCLDVTKRNTVRELLQIHWPQREAYAAARAENWNRYSELFTMLGFPPPNGQQPPLAFLLKAEEPYPARAIHERLREFGIGSEMDERDGIVALPCHAGLKKSHVDYIFGAFRGMVNPCYTFVRSDPAEKKS